MTLHRSVQNMRKRTFSRSGPSGRLPTRPAPSRARTLIFNAGFSPLDPTMTGDLRDLLVKEMVRRFRWLAKRVEEMFPLLVPPAVKTNDPYDFPTKRGSHQKFLDWLSEASGSEDGPLARNELGAPWMEPALQSTMARATRQAVDRLRSTPYSANIPAQGATALGRTEGMMDRAELVYGRAYQDLKNITSDMSTQISRVMAEGMMGGKSPREIARELASQVDGMSLTRAKTLARTEVIRAHHVATIQSYRELGVVGVEVQAEWKTSGILSGPGKVCERCLALEGRKFSLDAIQNMIPLHPNCRCIALPVVADESEVETEPPAAEDWRDREGEEEQIVTEANPEIRSMGEGELVDYTSQLVGGELNLGDLSAPTQREIVEALDVALPPEMDVQLDGITVEGGAGMESAYAGHSTANNQERILFSPTLETDVAWMGVEHAAWLQDKGVGSETVAKKLGRAFRFSTTLDSSVPIRSLALHEAGHVLYEQNGDVAMSFLRTLRRNYDSYGDDIYASLALRRAARLVSETAAFDIDELFAEVTSLMFDGRKAQVPQLIADAWTAARSVVGKL